jgi:transcriptional regulator with XRE-family HTH domain
MAGNWYEGVVATDEGFRLYQQEKAIHAVTELICEVMDQQGVSRTELARRLGKSKAYVSQMLDGSANMTLRTIADVFTALGRALSVEDIPLRRGEDGCETQICESQSQSVALSWRVVGVESGEPELDTGSVRLAG